MVAVPSLYVRKLCADRGLLTGWKNSAGFMKEEDADSIGFFDYGNASDGRYMRTGEYSLHPMIQIRTRAVGYDAAYKKLIDVFNDLSDIGPGDAVLVSMTDYPTVHVLNVSYRSGPIPIGVEEKFKRHGLVLNLSLTLKTLS